MLDWRTIDDDTSRAERARLFNEMRAALVFAASCIKSGDRWTPKCEEVIGGVLKRTRK